MRKIIDAATGDTDDFAMYAKDTISKKDVLISTDEYDVLRPTDEQIEYAQEKLGKVADIHFFEAVV